MLYGVRVLYRHGPAVFSMLGGVAGLRDEQVVYVNRGTRQVGREEKTRVLRL